MSNDFFKETRKRFLDLLAQISKTRKTDSLMNWLEKTDFFHAPASTVYHSNFEAGLAFHSANMAEILFELTEKNSLLWEDSTSPIFIGLFHDLCKVNCYKSEIKSRKTGQYYSNGKPMWEEYTGYTFESSNPIGDHGEKSVMLLMEHLKLTDEEKAAIRWHMGTPDGFTAQMTYLAATKKYPNILWVNLADRLAAIEEDA